MFSEILSMAEEWVLTHMVTSISRLLYPDRKLIDRVRVCLKGGSVSIHPNIPRVGMTLEIRNSLASSIKRSSIQADVNTDDYTLINNFSKILADELKSHSDKSDCSITLDLPDATAKIVGNHRADTMPLRLHGTLRFNALGRELVKPIELSMYCDINGLHGDVRT
jgi:hypothetical protein